MGQLIRSLQEKLPPESVIVLEAGRDLDGEILPDIECWDIRRYGDTQIAIRVLPETATDRASAERREGGEAEGTRLEEEGDV